jgi:hypothetical protein
MDMKIVSSTRNMEINTDPSATNRARRAIINMIMVLGLPELVYRLDSMIDRVISVIIHATPIVNAIKRSRVKFILSHLGC